MREHRISTTVTMHAVLWRARNLIALCIFCTLATGGVVTAQDLDDFRTAAAADGVNVIPFESLRRDATSVADEVERSKHEATQWKYDTYEDMKKNLLNKKAVKNVEIAAKEEEIEELEKLENADVSSYERELDELRDELGEINENIDNLNDDLEKAAEAWKRLWNARGGLRELFADAKSDVVSAKSRPEDYLGSDATEEDIESLKRYLDVIEDEIEAGEEGHRIQEEGAKTAEENFQNLIKMTE